MRLLAVVLVAGCGFGGSGHSGDDKPVDAPDPDAPTPISPRKLVFDATGINTTLTNVPVLVSLTSAQIDYSKVANAATDLKFVAGEQVLPHEIEQWNPNGESVVWVRVPSIAANSTDGSILMHFGAGAGTPDPVMVWQASQYDVVTHMKPADGDPNSYPNSVSGAYPATAVNVTTATGQLGPGIKLESSGEHRLTFGGSADLFSQWQAFTLELWLRPDYATMSQVTGEPGVVDKGGGLTLGRVFKAGVPPTESLKYQVDWNFPSDNVRISTVVETQTWNYVVYTYDGTTVTLYHDGVAIPGTPVSGGRMLAMSTAPFFLGGATNPITGTIDELRISPQPKPAEWIMAQFKSMSRQFVRFTDP